MGLPTIRIFCVACRTQLLAYHKRGKGGLVKVLDRRVARERWGDGGDDAVDRAAAGPSRRPTACPGCGAVWARPTVIAGNPARKVIGGKVFTRRG